MNNLINTTLAHAGDQDWSSMMGQSGGNIMSHMWGLGGGWGWTMMVLGGLFWILILVALILLIVWLIKQIQK